MGNESTTAERVLIVNHDTRMCRRVVRLLRERAILTDFATNAEEIDRCIAGTTYAVIGVPCRMPAGTGFDLIERCRARQPQAVFLMCSDHVATVLDVPSDRQGHFFVIPENADPEEFVSVIRRCLDVWRERLRYAQAVYGNEDAGGYSYGPSPGRTMDVSEEPPIEHATIYMDPEEDAVVLQAEPVVTVTGSVKHRRR